MQFWHEIASEAEVIRWSMHSVLRRVSKQRICRDLIFFESNRLTKIVWFRQFSELDRIGRGADVVGQSVPGGRTRMWERPLAELVGLIRSLQRCAAGLLLRARRVEDIDRLLHGRRRSSTAAYAGSAAFTAGVGSWKHTCWLQVFHEAM